ncbi:hypothetical protein MNBD_BACTEROID05-510 [hydrothermal vent metagenome]|uniref:Mce/MlaD domain-containing protein n=1 Tax=hydrothermal vent metagenome TaxID=652676 RepID=A0A3B0TZZ8_9ZZZZ
MKNKNREIMAAGFFLGGIILLFAVIFMIGKDKGLTKPKFQVEVLFRNIGGLMDGAPVRLSGVTIGNVGSIDFLDKAVKGRKVKVVLNIFTKYRSQLASSTNFSIKNEGVLGEKLLEIYVVEGKRQADFTKPIIGEDPLDVNDLAGVFSGAATSFTKTAEELSKVNMLELSEVMRDSSRALLVTAEEINRVIDEVEDMSIKAKRMLDRVEQMIIDGNLFKVF